MWCTGCQYTIYCRVLLFCLTTCRGSYVALFSSTLTRIVFLFTFYFLDNFHQIMLQLPNRQNHYPWRSVSFFLLQSFQGLKCWLWATPGRCPAAWLASWLLLQWQRLLWRWRSAVLSQRLQRALEQPFGSPKQCNIALTQLQTSSGSYQMHLWRAVCCLSQQLQDLRMINEAELLFIWGAECAQCCADTCTEYWSFVILC